MGKKQKPFKYECGFAGVDFVEENPKKPFTLPNGQVVVDIPCSEVAAYCGMAAAREFADNVQHTYMKGYPEEFWEGDYSVKVRQLPDGDWEYFKIWPQTYRYHLALEIEPIKCLNPRKETSWGKEMVYKFWGEPPPNPTKEGGNNFPIRLTKPPRGATGMRNLLNTMISWGDGPDDISLCPWPSTRHDIPHPMTWGACNSYLHDLSARQRQMELIRYALLFMVDYKLSPKRVNEVLLELEEYVAFVPDDLLTNALRYEKYGEY